MSFGEVNNKKSMLNFSQIESVSISICRVKHMSIANVSFVLSPASSSHEVVTINNVKFVHLITTFRIEGSSIEIDSAFLELVLWIS